MHAKNSEMPLKKELEPNGYSRMTYRQGEIYEARIRRTKEMINSKNKYFMKYLFQHNPRSVILNLIIEKVLRSKLKKKVLAL